MKRSEFINKVKRRLGWPMVKVELCDDQIVDHLWYAREKFIKWAVGNATDIIYFTMLLEGGKRFYDLPQGVIDILEYDEDSLSAGGGVNTLFTIENYFFSQGYYDGLLQTTATLVGYHQVLEFIEALERYMPDRYAWRYHKKTNQLELTPTPAYNRDEAIVVQRVDPETNTMKSYVYDSPGYVLIRANVIEGTTLPSVIREWDAVMKEIVPATELRRINDNEKDNEYFVLTSPAFDGKLTIWKNGEIYDKWEFFDDYHRTIKWLTESEIELNDELLCKYKTVSIYPSSDSYSYTDEFEYKNDSYTITPANIITKSFMLSEKTIKKEDITVFFNGQKYVYGSGFMVDSDDQTILFTGKSLDGVLVNGSVLRIEFPNETSNIEEYDESLYDKIWLLDYVTALSKISLGLIRRKFSSFNSIGNTGISLDGDMLVSEGTQEREKLDEELRSEETFEGGYIIIG